ncbi:PD40 domain-containing protein [candidate division KSB1 bacterium]|nr:PD40 domain-containing protein [candidate division KSB1 bacterium]
MKSRMFYLIIILAIIGLNIFLFAARSDYRDALAIGRLPFIEPDYSQIVVPPNIAPMNFLVKEEGQNYRAVFSGFNGEQFEVISRHNKIIIPSKKWQTMLQSNRGLSFFVDIYVQQYGDKWQKYDRIQNKIAEQDIDRYLVYRLIEPLYILWKKVGIYQRDLTGYHESAVLENRPLSGACLNCHSFCKNNADKMILHMRAGPGTSMLLNNQGVTSRVDTKTEFNSSPAAYPAWHPDGKLLAFSVNKVNQYFHGIGENRDVFDWASDIILYSVPDYTVTTCQKIATPERMETWPTWSPDGKYLYFCSAPTLNRNVPVIEQYPSTLYDLYRIPYDPAEKSWGELELVLSHEVTGLSITQPRISPDGRFLLFTMASYGNFPVYRPDSDLYMMDLQSGTWEKISANSDKTDSFHSWSSNSKWIVFSSKRADGLCAQPFFCYIEKSGQTSKPFVLPQKDPAFSQTFYKTYNVPELVFSRITVRPQILAATALNIDKTIKARLDPDINFRSNDGGDTTPWLPAK